MTGLRLDSHHSDPGWSPFAPPNWTIDALCAKAEDPDLWFPATLQVGALAKEIRAICDACPVRETCLETALTNNEADGWWGGMSPNERMRLKKKGVA